NRHTLLSLREALSTLLSLVLNAQKNHHIFYPSDHKVSHPEAQPPQNREWGRIGLSNDEKHIPIVYLPGLLLHYPPLHYPKYFSAAGPYQRILLSRTDVANRASTHIYLF